MGGGGAPPGAHLNGLETFPWFASAHMVGGPSRIADILAVVDILLRVGHMADAVRGIHSGSVRCAPDLHLAAFSLTIDSENPSPG